MTNRATVTMVLLAAATFLLFGVVPQPLAANPGTHLCNLQRTGYTPEGLAPPYELDWVYSDRHKPAPAWKEPLWEPQRIDDDYAYPISSSNGMVYFGSSSDHAVHALDLATGRPQWSFFTEAPVRLAPAVGEGRIFAGSDDGNLYCLDGAGGELIWQFSPDVPDERLIGNGQMMSRWPARAGALLDGDRVYTAFGIWSNEGIFVYCLDAEDGSVIWCNDTSGNRYETLPHYSGMAGVSPHGYLARSGDVLIVPCGRAAPALFDTNTGQLLYHEGWGYFIGGTWTMGFEDLMFAPCPQLHKPNPLRHGGEEASIHEEASLAAFRARSGDAVFHLRGALKGVISPDGVMSLIRPGGLVSVNLDEIRAAAGRVEERQRIYGPWRVRLVSADDHSNWQVSTDRIYRLLQAGDTLIAGGRGAVQCFDAANGKGIWEHAVTGQVRDLLIADGAILASTTAGKIYCFRPRGRGAGDNAEQVSVRTEPIAVATGVEARAERILSAGGVTEGYCLIAGEASTELLAELAGESQLTIYHPTRSADIAGHRERLNEAGLYGTRIGIHDATLQPLPYIDYFADLAVLNVPSADVLERIPAAELYRTIRPYGGVGIIAFGDDLWPRVQRWLQSAEADIPDDEWQRIGIGVRIDRGSLPGAGQWTHQYANPGKTCASDERRIHLPLKVLWFGGMGPAKSVSRHYRTPAPVVVEGRAFVPGTDHLVAMNAYNGRVIWDRELQGLGRWPASHRGCGLAADNGAVYALHGMNCLRLDPATGETLHTYEAPLDESGITEGDLEGEESQLVWEHLAVIGDMVIGSIGEPNIWRTWWSQAHTANHCIFAMHKASGEVLWIHRPGKPIASTAIAIADGRVYIIEGRPRFHFLRRGKPQTREAGTRTLKALELASGRELWSTEDLSADASDVWVNDGVVLLTISSDTHAPFRLWARQQKRGKERRWPHEGPKKPWVSGYSTEDGSLLWQADPGGSIQPTIIDDVLYLPAAHNLHTGESINVEDPLTGNPVPFTTNLLKACSRYAACPTMLFSRSGGLGFYDIENHTGLYQYTNVRASCWINIIPACGVVVVPDGSSSCPCAYSYKTSLAFVPDERHDHWGVYGRMYGARRWKQASRLRINFGAPGDRPDGRGNLWFAYPRPSPAGGGPRPPIANVPIKIPDGAAQPKRLQHNPDHTQVANTDAPWLYTYGWEGDCVLQMDLAEGGAPYRVSLHFCELDRPPAPRICDVRFDGDIVIHDLDVVEEAGGPGRALVKEFTVNASGSVTLELVARGDGPPPIISALEVLQDGKQ